MRLKLFNSSARHFATRLGNPLFLQSGFLTKERKSELMLDIKQLEFFPKIIKNCSDRDINYHEADVNFREARDFKPISPLSLSSITPYSFYGFMAMNCFRGYWHDSLIDRDIAEKILNLNRSNDISLDNIFDIRDQLGVSTLLPPRQEEMFTILQQIPYIPYDSSQKLIIAVNYTQPVKESIENKPISIPLLNLRSDLIFKLALYFTDIFKLLSQNWLLNNVQNQKFSMFSSCIVNDKAKLHECMLKLAGELIKQNAEIMLITAKLIQLMSTGKLDDTEKFSPKELLDVMTSWNIPIAQLNPSQVRKTEKPNQDNDHDFDKNNKKYPNFVDTKKMEKALAEAAKNGPYY